MSLLKEEDVGLNGLLSVLSSKATVVQLLYTYWLEVNWSAIQYESFYLFISEFSI